MYLFVNIHILKHTVTSFHPLRRGLHVFSSIYKLVTGLFIPVSNSLLFLCELCIVVNFFELFFCCKFNNVLEKNHWKLSDFNRWFN
jgi:hypothetical protein